mmetsp:Transcript_653/g.698  ORF Transcript_653/g.698 Transcript_653/m.698 type:complete len:93 (-) Transcript_653:36-314(-)
MPHQHKKDRKIFVPNCHTVRFVLLPNVAFALEATTITTSSLLYTNYSSPKSDETKLKMNFRHTFGKLTDPGGIVATSALALMTNDCLRRCDS